MLRERYLPRSSICVSRISTSRVAGLHYLATALADREKLRSVRTFRRSCAPMWHSGERERDCSFLPKLVSRFLRELLSTDFYGFAASPESRDTTEPFINRGCTIFGRRSLFTAFPPGLKMDRTSIECCLHLRRTWEM